ncbi:NACHT domain-containing protein [Streptomyces sp. NPDC054932]
MRRDLKWAGLLYALAVAGGLAAYLKFSGVDQIERLMIVVGAFTGVLALPAAVITAVRHNATAGGPLTPRLEEVADQLAQGMRQQWENEERVRRLNDPYPLPVEWKAADADLFESWTLLLDLAGAKPDHPMDGESEWAQSPSGLSGKWGDIGQVYERIPTRRLVVLGEPGAGKTMLLVRLLLTLLEQRRPGGPVPALFSLASWDPARQDLYAWMADQLARDHPSLHDPSPARSPKPDPGIWARDLIEERLVLPVLDGLDELPEAARPLALHCINQVMRPGRPLVLSCRTSEYRRALAPQSGVPVLLNGTAGIQIDPLDAAQAVAYLLRDSGGPGTAAAARWRRVAASLGTGTPLSQALSTPLGLFLARTIYNPRPDGVGLVDLANPDELLDQTRFRTRQEVDAHLFRIFIPAAYNPHHRQPSPWSVRQAERTLAFLARNLEHNLNGNPNLAWWQLHRAFPRLLSALVVGLAVGLVYGLPFGLLTDAELGAQIGLFFAVPGTALLLFPPKDTPAEGIRWSWKGHFWVRTLLPAAVVGLGFGLIGVPLGYSRDSLGYPRDDYRYALVGALLGIVVGALLGGLRSRNPDLRKAVGPGAVLTQDRRTFWTVALSTGLVSCLVFGLLYQLSEASRTIDALTIALPLGILFGVGTAQLGFARSVWLVFLVTRIELAVLGRVPWRFMAFLADAHERRGVLRQVGAVYQFRHLDLQRHLAGPPPKRHRHPQNPPYWPPLTPSEGNPRSTDSG